MIYEILILPQAEKEISKLPDGIAESVIEAIEKLATNPKPVGSIQMNNFSTPRLKVRVFHRIRVKKVYRIIYHIENKVCIITVVKIGHRSKVYE